MGGGKTPKKSSKQIKANNFFKEGKNKGRAQNVGNASPSSVG